MSFTPTRVEGWNHFASEFLAPRASPPTPSLTQPAGQEISSSPWRQEIGRVQAWPILVAAQVPAEECTVNLRSSVRRGRLTGSLRVLMFWSDDWLLQSEWYSWSLPR